MTHDARTMPGSARGFTLLEIGIGIVLLSLLMAIAVPSMNALSGARLKESVGVLGGAIRDTYARTALSGHSARLVIDLDASAWWVEEADVVARVQATKIEADRNGKVELDAKDERIADIEADTDDDKERAKVQLLTGPAFKPVDGEWGQQQKLPADVRFTGIWLEHLDDKVAHGQAALYFFPGGFTEEGFITLSDDEDGGNTLSLVVQSLTGEVYVESEEPRVPTLEDDA